jgi:glycosyltransferase involved in cell wall biosynthesis
MRVLVICNFNNHLQSAFLQNLQEVIGEKSVLLAETQTMSSERVDLGWQQSFPSINCVSPFRSESDLVKYRDWVQFADVVISGERMMQEFRTRSSLGLPTFYMSERWWKPPLGRFRLLHPRFIKLCLNFRSIARSPTFWFLPIGDQAAVDLSTILGLGSRQRRWGYFPETPLNVEQLEERSVPTILWAGRFIRWKRVEVLIRAYKRVLDRGCKCRLELIGEGPLKLEMQSLITRLSLDQHVTISPSIPHQKVLAKMRSSEIYALPSQGHEGWGAVVNEAMASGCLVLASPASGAGGTLIRNEFNGFVINDSSVEAMAEKLVYMVNNLKSLKRIRIQAMDSISTNWSARIAATRFNQFANAICQGVALPAWNYGVLSALNSEATVPRGRNK